MLLAIETATAACSVAVWRDDEEFHLFKVVERAHAECLLPMLETVTLRANADFSHIDAVAVGVGPGAFTSLRIGLAAARGLALALARPCLGVTSLEAVAEAACPLAAAKHGAACVLVALDSKRGDLFVQPFSASGRSLTVPAIVAADDVAAHLDAAGVKRDEIVAVAGDAAAITCTALAAAGYAVRMVDACRFPTALSVARLAAARWLAGDRAPAPPRPLYLRPADTGPPMAPAPRAGERSRASG